jgi:mono/diheme cytochrome c family protein
MPEIPDFTNASWQEKRSDAQLMVSITDGKGTSMPQFGTKLRKEDVQALVAYIRALDPPAKQGQAPEGDFDKRFRQLQEEMKEPRRQFRALMAPPKR